MTKYDLLDAKTELEQVITKDLERALNKRGFTVKHNGSATNHAPGGVPDIEVINKYIQINIEVTKTTKSSSDREYLSIKEHLEKSKGKQPTKKCFVWYISPETHYRMISAVKEYNILNKEVPDMKILPICFATFELFVNKLIETTKDEYKQDKILNLFSKYIEYVNDEKILRIFYEELFPSDTIMKKDLEIKEENKHQQVVQELIKGLTKLEQDLRDYRIALSTDAIKNVIYLVFIKLYEEKREYEGKENRFTKSSFLKYQEYIGQEKSKMAIHELFNNIKQDKELIKTHLFTEENRLSGKMDDDFVIKYFIEPFSKHHFFTTKIDGLGAAYEVLGKLSGKDVKVGQFFTPENVVKFMVKLAELESTDKVLDPACGTGRFLIYSMGDMIEKVTGSNKTEQITKIKINQLFGSDDDINVAKLAKMNMYIHGDGKTNIMDRDGLKLFDFDDKIDVILTNPPLGDLTYMKDTYEDDFRLKRMVVIPRKNITDEKMKTYEERLKFFSEKLKVPKITPKRIKQIEKKMTEYKDKIAECKLLMKQGKEVYETTGNLMKGGALFTNACFHYLKKSRDRSGLPEWRGGKLLIILDEGVLNTDNYKETREFIRKNFYIKAIISLTRDAFVPVSNTSTKTSILYAIKKEDPDALQQEPIFFAHAEKVGIDTRKKVCPNYLFNSGNDVLSKYNEFKDKVLASYEGTRFNKIRFGESGFSKGDIDG